MDRRPGPPPQGLMFHGHCRGRGQEEGLQWLQGRPRQGVGQPLPCAGTSALRLSSQPVSPLIFQPVLTTRKKKLNPSHSGIFVSPEDRDELAS